MRTTYNAAHRVQRIWRQSEYVHRVRCECGWKAMATDQILCGRLHEQHTMQVYAARDAPTR